MTNTETKIKSSDQTKPTPKPDAKTANTRPKSPRRNTPETAASPVAVAPSAAAAPVSKPTKRDQLAALLVRGEGATIDQMIAATGLAAVHHARRADRAEESRICHRKRQGRRGPHLSRGRAQ